MLRPVSRYKQKNPKAYTRPWLEERLDELVSQIIRLRGKGCVTCPARTRLTCSHLFSRYFRPTRFDIELGGNCMVQCWDCNSKHNDDKKPLTDYYTKKFGERAYHDLATRAHSNDKVSYQDLYAKWESYKLILAQMKGKGCLNDHRR